VVGPAAWAGSTSTVSYGYSQAEGTLVVVKKVKRTSHTAKGIDREIRNLRALQHVRHLFCSLVPC